MANQPIRTSKVKGKGRVYTQVCKIASTSKVEKRVGNPKCCNKSCPHFVRFTTNREGQRCVHCKDI